MLLVMKRLFTSYMPVPQRQRLSMYYLISESFNRGDDPGSREFVKMLEHFADATKFSEEQKAKLRAVEWPRNLPERPWWLLKDEFLMTYLCPGALLSKS